ncbi:hypothetical protein G6L67_04215 [Agrobacterium tumefaciens]|uniref:Uncharacterized protein n=1 Tax=Agrobacterium tumefaciens str. Kerr 14 TaxID=1183424 RepID=A0A1S7Q3S0_AGRTU|nr:hypothetical protein [Agrobacterium tumefaciens]AYM80352.1 hypothetical protein At12D1_04650 [Agrobacterium tumefaciens]NTE91051.1 hypothetical protein [Agrobacterium tumefaciens]CUX30595.1 conserved hypothetical protein [Agrobacterium tumefaciens str. Kerr 14]
MADSDNTTTLPFVTRRVILAGTAIAMGTWGSTASVTTETAGIASSDPVLPLWHRWRDANRLTERLRRKQQGLERQLAETVSFPFVAIQLSDGRRVAAYSLEAIHDVFRFTPEEREARAKAEAEFAAHQLRWDRADRDIGYSAAVQAERDAGDRAEDLLGAMAAMSATTLAGVAAKLDAVLHEGNIWEDGSEFPWPHIRSALDDIRRLKEYASKGGTA